METLKPVWLPELLYSNGLFQHNMQVICDGDGQISSVADSENVDSATKLHNRAALPGLVNAHSHAFQRVIRGRTEYRSTNEKDSFWTWREMMYSAAARLTPEDIYDASRMAFLEMALSGITCVGEFHYLHNAPDGQPYEDANFLAKQVVRAAQDVGLRIASSAPPGAPKLAAPLMVAQSNRRDARPESSAPDGSPPESRVWLS